MILGTWGAAQQAWGLHIATCRGLHRTLLPGVSEEARGRFCMVLVMFWFSINSALALG